MNRETSRLIKRNNQFVLFRLAGELIVQPADTSFAVISQEEVFYVNFRAAKTNKSALTHLTPADDEPNLEDAFITCVTFSLRPSSPLRMLIRNANSPNLGRIMINEVRGFTDMEQLNAV